MVNQGKLPEAVKSFEEYLKLDGSERMLNRPRACWRQSRSSSGFKVQGSRFCPSPAISPKSGNDRGIGPSSGTAASRGDLGCRLEDVWRRPHARGVGGRATGVRREQGAGGLQKIADTADSPARWHLIGHLQSNKAKKAAAAFACIQSVDSVELLHRLDDGAGQRPPGTAPLEVLVQVDFAGEATKFGAGPDEAAETVRAAAGAKHVQLAGLMSRPPLGAMTRKPRGPGSPGSASFAIGWFRTWPGTAFRPRTCCGTCRWA